MRKKNLRAAAVGLIIGSAQLTQAAGMPVWAETGAEQPTEETASEEAAEEMMKTETERGLSENGSALVDADNQIGAALTEKLAASGKNVFLSSYSIASALAMLAHCSESGEQIDALKAFLGYDEMTEDQILEAQKELAAAIGVSMDDTELSDENPETKPGSWENSGIPESILETANAIYIDDQLNTVSAFPDLTKLLEDGYRAVLKQTDLSSEETMNEINQWVDEKTHGLINSILGEPMSEDVRMTLLNAVYFKAAWLRAFEKEATDQQAFHGTEGSAQVSMMHQQESFDYAENDDYQMVRLPYYGGYAMTVYLPKDTKTAEKWSEEGYLQALGSETQEWNSREVLLSLPKFEMEYGAELKDTLQALGLDTLFGENVYDRVSEDPLAVGSVFHKTAIKNDENGTEAAAVTMIMVETMALVDQDELVEMTVDHPFYFTITHQETGLNLFEGCIFNLD